MFMFHIYKIKCLANGKVYIGQSKNIDKRWKEHRYELNRGIHHSIHLQRAWSKYGEDRFEFEIIETCSDQNTADERERYWIEEYDSTNKNKGFNLESGGNRFKKLSEETKRKIGRANKYHYHKKNKYILNSPEVIKRRSESNTGKKRSKEFRDKMSKIASQRTGERNPFYGRKHTKEFRRMMSERFTGVTRRPPKPIKAVNVNTGETMSFSSRKEAEEHGFNRTGICNVLKGKWSNYKGYVFIEGF